MSEILFLTHLYPYPPNDGGRIVTYNTLKVLSQRHKIHCISFKEELEQEVNFENIEQYLINKNYKNKPIDLLLNVFKSTPYTMDKYKSRIIENEIVKILTKNNINIVILDHLHMAHYYKIIRKHDSKIKIFLRQHNIESIIMKRAYEKEKKLFKRIYLYLQYKKLYKYEKEICGKMDRNFVITEEDKMTLDNMTENNNNIVVKAGVDLEKYKPRKQDVSHATKKLVFLGAMNWLPNEEGISWFVEEIFPHIISDIEDIKLYIVGKNPTDQVKKLVELYPENIIVTGFVEDDRDYISMADVFIVPLNIGGGMRLKILNALAMKKAIVTTSIGAEGINLNNSYIVADEAKDFARSVIDILQNKELRLKLEKRGLEEVKRNYSFEAVLEPLLTRL
ncbi:glycosyltransferase [Terribacillus saccharophilus]|uniref:glycosyltransferase n=1 Tax=Terribacillus saccharophilus TaxID=361277 RepID=UPI002DCBD0D7|nr:glycosyltransferase [Terribacillus saccharophilus]MEC0291165.1 glycosyltransferase [Terribacillus saccharophilus]